MSQNIDPTPSDMSPTPCHIHAGFAAHQCEECAEELEDYFDYLDAGESRYRDDVA